MAEKFDEFIEEVENDIRQEKWMNLWKRYGSYVSGSFVGLLAITAAYNYWQSYELKQREESAHRLILSQEMLASGKIEGALSSLRDLAQDGNAIYRGLAHLTAATAYAHAGPQKNIEEALRLLENLQTDKSVDILIKDMALLQCIRIQIDEGTIKEEFLTKIEGLCHQDHHWHYLARELKGIILFKLGKNHEALEVFSELARDSKTPEGILMRSQMMSQILQTL